MSMNIEHYIKEINREFVKGNSTEHTFRGTLKNLLENLCENIDATNEPKKTEGGNPDYQITKKGTKIPVAFIEAKDIDKDLNDKNYNEQFNRYKKAYNNLIITDYLNFKFYEKEKLIFEIRLAEVVGGKVQPINKNFNAFEDYLKPFFDKPSITIKSPQKLAEMMAARGRILQDIIENAVLEDIKNENRNSKIYGYYLNFKRLLIHDLDEKQFSDIFAQTLTYGLFAARLYDDTPNDFSRQEAAVLIPKSNPFLRDLFVDIAGPNIDERIERTVDNLADVFVYTDIEKLLKDFGKNTKTHDPIIHFYETFLTEYDKGLKQSRGVWYTPEPVVKFIVKSVDEILKSEFDIKNGLADTSKIKIKKDVPRFDNRSKSKSIITGTTKVEKEVHKVQILDPATGTGTFLGEVIKFIYEKKYKNLEAVWNSYVEKDLIPRLNGFELLMAPYSMAHVKLAMLLKETGYKSENNTRFNVFLTNSLEEFDEKQTDLFSPLLSQESSLANSVKKDTPVMCVIGNPPYNRTSNNASKFIVKLLDDYRKDLNERNLVPLDDDYIKFIKYGQHYIDKNGEGILAYISSNSFVDGVTHKQMRKNLLETFDKVYILNLHGNAKKREKCPDGSVDQNVFDIMTGVSINIFIKNNQNKKKFGDVLQYDLYGKRDVKYSYLQNSEIKNIDWSKLELKTNFEPWIKFDSSLVKYDKYLLVTDIFNAHTPCVRTHKDKKLVSFSRFNTETNQKYLFKAFDNRFVDFDLKKIGRSRIKVMHNMMHSENISLIYQRGFSSEFPHTPFISKLISDQGAVRPGTTSTSTMSPLYTYPIKEDGVFKDEKRKPNLNQEIVSQIAKKIGLAFTNEKEDTKNTFAPIDILDYIYAVLHSPTYREKYKGFLKIDFPRVPYPKDATIFWKLVKFGGSLRELHLLESDLLDDHFINIIGCKGVVSDPKKNLLVDRKMTKNSIGYVAETNTHGNVWINDIQYFSNVPLKAWEFYIGGYQPAQKWLKDRYGRNLLNEEVTHYQKIIVALNETHNLMQEIDNHCEILS